MSACKLLTALARVTTLVEGQAVETVAADDVWDAMHRLGETLFTSMTAARELRDEGRQSARACPDDLRRGTRVRLELDLIHDAEPEELLAVLMARVERILDEDDVDLGDVSTSWEPRELGVPVQ